jgi:hypothetical protein
MAGQFQFVYTPATENLPSSQQQMVDPWKSWFFNLSASGYYSGEEATDYSSVSGSFRASRITDAWKFRLRASGNLSRSTFDLGDETIESRTETGTVTASLVGSLGNRWSAGLSSEASRSSRQNQEFLASIAPAIEFNVFPYTESSRREIRVQYRIQMQYVVYEDTTIFNKATEKLLFHTLSLQLDFQQTWGSANMEIGARNYITDLEAPRTEFYNVFTGGTVGVRIARGLFLDIGGSISFVHDQLYLPKGGANEEEILLRTKNLPTDYSFSVSLGLSYNFGSRFNNVVNTRFGL